MTLPASKVDSASVKGRDRDEWYGDALVGSLDIYRQSEADGHYQHRLGRAGRGFACQPEESYPQHQHTIEAIYDFDHTLIYSRQRDGHENKNLDIGFPANANVAADYVIAASLSLLVPILITGQLTH
jgi:hypothetical protein